MSDRARGQGRHDGPDDASVDALAREHFATIDAPHGIEARMVARLAQERSRTSESRPAMTGWLRHATAPAALAATFAASFLFARLSSGPAPDADLATLDPAILVLIGAVL